jgi:malonyl-CoA O-methyltransferase
VTALEAHRIWSEVYDEFPNPLLALEMRVVAGLLEPLENRRFVDVGCGTGRWLAHAESQGARVFGIDFCCEMLLRAAAKPRLAGRLALANAERLPFPDRVADLVVCSFVIGYLDEPSLAVRQMERVSAPGAKIVVSELHPDAVEAGWKRGFRHNGTAYEIEHSPHPIPCLLEAASEAGLRLDCTEVASFGEPEREIFLRAGKAHLFDDASRVPAIWTGVWSKP